MESMNKPNNDSTEVPKLKERHIVTWSQEEDDILREQIRIHGTDNWAIIASKFKDKTTRQCRRRWYTYLNSDFKKGGWSPEEDMLLCEAQKIFGNRWTEIAKVVSGRTDNAVKNRFSTLCKKRAKHEALAKENTSYLNLNNKRVLFQNGLSTDGILETAAPQKKRRYHIPDITENLNHGERLLMECGTANQQPRLPFAVLVQNINNASGLPTQNLHNTKETSKDGNGKMIQGTYLKKDDPKIIALMQQAELLSSLALKVNTENTDQSLENAWKALQDFLSQSKECDMLRFNISDMDFQLENFKDLVEDLRSSNEGSRSSWRQPDLYEESPDSSEYSSGSTILSYGVGDKTEQRHAGLCALRRNIEAELQLTHIGEPNGLGEAGNDVLSSATTAQEFSSPFQVTPLFRSLAAGIPSPQFSESERHFLLKTLGMESTSPNPSNKPSQPPPCKRILLHSL